MNSTTELVDMVTIEKFEFCFDDGRMQVENDKGFMEIVDEPRLPRRAQLFITFALKGKTLEEVFELSECQYRNWLEFFKEAIGPPPRIRVKDLKDVKLRDDL